MKNSKLFARKLIKALFVATFIFFVVMVVASPGNILFWGGANLFFWGVVLILSQKKTNLGT